MQQDLATFRSALNLFRLNAGRYPSSDEGLAALVARPASLHLEQWEQMFEKEQLDPWQNPYRYEFPPKRRDDGEPDISSAGADMIFGSEDDVGNWEDEG